MINNYLYATKADACGLTENMTLLIESHVVNYSSAHMARRAGPISPAEIVGTVNDLSASTMLRFCAVRPCHDHSEV